MSLRYLLQIRSRAPAFALCTRASLRSSNFLSCHKHPGRSASLLSSFRPLSANASKDFAFTRRLQRDAKRFDVCRREYSSVEVMELKGRIVVYSIVGCPHCVRTKTTLQEVNLPYTDISFDTYPHLREEVKARTGRRTVPQVFFNAIHIGGNDDFQKLVKDKERFAQMVEEVKNNVPPADAPQPPKEADALYEVSDTGEFVCEPDEYAALVQDLKQSGIIKDHTRGLKTVKSSFTGKDFVDWVVRSKKLDRELAAEMGQHLLDKHFGLHLSRDQVFHDGNDLYRLLEDDDSHALNADEISTCDPLPAGELGEIIRVAILKIFNSYLSRDGRSVDYKGMGKSAEFQEYVKLTRELQRVKIESANREEKLAFFINVYNALVIHANVIRGPPTNLWQRYKFFNTVQYLIGGFSYSLQEIENGVLRANRKGVGQLFNPFSKGDLRLNVALDRPEPLAHFGMVCGAKSCPPIKTYSTAKIYEELTMACEAFLEGDDGCQVDLKAGKLKLSQIFSWYRSDFGKNDAEVAAWVAKYLAPGEKKQNLEELLKGKFRIVYLHYDWSSNSKE